MQDRIYGYLGLAMKAGRVKAGEFSVEKSIKEGKATLVILGKYASENTEKKLAHRCFY